MIMANTDMRVKHEYVILETVNSDTSEHAMPSLSLVQGKLTNYNLPFDSLQ